MLVPLLGNHYFDIEQDNCDNMPLYAGIILNMVG